jgi:hypothetical protein
VGYIKQSNYFVATPESNNNNSTRYTFELSDSSTDNFGNLLVKDKKYVPVVLSVLTGNEENANQYTNSLSSYQDTVAFVYN